MKATRYENRAELIVLHRNKRPIGYKFHNGTNSKRFNANMVYVKSFSSDTVL